MNTKSLTREQFIKRAEKSLSFYEMTCDLF